jgi:pyrroline-5-carboxylate reductase
MTHTLGIIGYGNMGSAIARGITTSAALRAAFPVLAFDRRQEVFRSETGVRIMPGAAELAREADFVLLAVKPGQLASVVEGIKGSLSRDKTLLSIAAGVPLRRLRALAAGLCPVVQIMPNTPAGIGQGVFGLCLDDPELPDARKEVVATLFKGLGKTLVVPENKMNAFSAVTGCGPAYVFQLMDAVMEAAVTLGFTRQEARGMVISLFGGSAALLEQSGEHPSALHAAVTSPGGMTIAGTNHLARTAVRGHIIDAILAANARGLEMERENE